MHGRAASYKAIGEALGARRALAMAVLQVQLVLATTLRDMARINTILHEVFDSPCQAEAVKAQIFNKRDIANMLWAMARSSRAHRALRPAVPGRGRS